MKIITSLLNKARIRSSLMLGCITFMAISMSVSAFGEDVKTISIVTPSWKAQTNEDGTGLFFDIVRSVYEPFGVKMEYKIIPWSRAEKMIQSKEADAMLSARKKKNRITPNYPMFVEYTSAVYKKDNIKNWEGLNNLRGKNAVWLRGYDFHTDDKLKDLKFKWDEVDNHDEGWGMLNKGRVDFFIDPLVDMNQYIKTNKVDMNPFEIKMLWGENAFMSFADTKKTRKLMRMYDEQIIKLYKSGELEKLYKKWDIKFSPDAWK